MPDDRKLLTSLTDTSFLLVSSLELKEILSRAMETIKKLLACEAASIMLVDEEKNMLSFEVALGEKGERIKHMLLPIGDGIAGKVVSTGVPLLVNDVGQSGVFTGAVDKRSGFTTKSVLCVPLKVRDKVIGVAEAINPLEKTGFADDDLVLLALFSNQVALAIESSRLHGEIIKRKIIESELDFARQVQESFLALEFPRGDTFSFSAFSRSAKKVGGDFYDVFRLDDERLGFAIGDVSGKGVPAALFMAKIMGQLRFLAQKHKDAGDPSLVLAELNTSLFERHSQSMFVTLIYGIFMPAANKLILSGAGHPYPFLHRAAGKKWEIAPLANGLPAAVIREARYENTAFALGRGDMVVFVTDGVTEANKDIDESFILEELTRMSLPDGYELTSEILIKKFAGFISMLEPPDDFTLLVLNVKK